MQIHRDMVTSLKYWLQNCEEENKNSPRIGENLERFQNICIMYLSWFIFVSITSSTEILIIMKSNN